MSPQTLSEKDQFLDTLEHEFETTKKVLAAYPKGKEEFKPAESSRNARDLAWMFVTQEKLLDAISRGEMLTQQTPVPQVTVVEILAMYEQAHRETVNKLRAMPAEGFDKTMQFPVGPKQMGDKRVGWIAWFVLMDAIHHRGQFSVYLRMLGGKVPAIYGPSADEPWR